MAVDNLSVTTTNVKYIKKAATLSLSQHTHTHTHTHTRTHTYIYTNKHILLDAFVVVVTQCVDGPIRLISDFEIGDVTQ